MEFFYFCTFIPSKRKPHYLETTFYSNGKLLLTGEYIVLDGAKALALPTVYGQSLRIKENNSGKVSWQSFDSDQTAWIATELQSSAIINNSLASANPLEQKLVTILSEANKLNPSFLENNKGYEIKTELTFPKNWGLGSSSTLINNLSKWLDINPYKLLHKTFSGSGYDIACASNDSPILFSLEQNNPLVEAIDFNPVFAEHLYFVYLNQKQNSRSAIASYYHKQFNLSNTIQHIDSITQQILKTNDLYEFSRLLENHEAIMSNILEMQTVKEVFFSDFKGMVKSLGAWGGDFVLAVAKEDPTAYFKQKGFDIIIPYHQMILPQKT